MQIHENFLRRSRIADLGRHFVTDFVRDTAARLTPGSRLLDAGAGECVYRPFFNHCRYLAVDLAVGEGAWNYTRLDAVAALDALPLREGTMDAVLCTQVLEHVADPARCLAEAFRVLRDGGKLYLTVPMAQSEHQIPYDYYRFTSYGLRLLCEQAGFGECRIEPLGGGMFTRWAYELPRAMAIFPGTGLRQGRPSLRGCLIAPLRFSVLALVRLAQLLLLALEPLDRQKDDPFGWKLVASKDRPRG